MPIGQTRAGPVWIQFNDQYSTGRSSQQITVISQHMMQFEATGQREGLSLGRSFSTAYDLPHSFADWFHFACVHSSASLDQQMMTLLILFYYAQQNHIPVTGPVIVSCGRNGTVIANLGPADASHISVKNSHFANRRDSPERNIQVGVYVRDSQIQLHTFEATAKPDVVICSVRCRLEAEEETAHYRDEDDDEDDRGCFGRLFSKCYDRLRSAGRERQSLTGSSESLETAHYQSFHNHRLLLSALLEQTHSGYLLHQLGRHRESLSAY